VGTRILKIGLLPLWFDRDHRKPLCREGLDTHQTFTFFPRRFDRVTVPEIIFCHQRKLIIILIDVAFITS